jgi:hypothetical protein
MEPLTPAQGGLTAGAALLIVALLLTAIWAIRRMVWLRRYRESAEAADSMDVGSLLA